MGSRRTNGLDSVHPKCINIGIRCGGYRHLNQSPDSPVEPATSQIERSLQRLPTQNSRERSCMEYFYFKIAPRLGGYFHQSFWNQKILVLCLEEPVIRTSIVAFSSLYEITLKQETNPKDVSDPQEQFALEYYNRALRDTANGLDNLESIRVLLTSCVIFFCIDCLRKDIPVALKHIRGGLKLLQIWRERYHRALELNETSALKSDFDFIESDLVLVFSWLNMISVMFGGVSHSINNLSSSSTVRHLSGPFNNIVDARASLVDIVDQTIQIVQKFNDYSKGRAVSSNDKAMQLIVLGTYNDWKISFENMMEKDAGTWSPAVRNGANLILASWWTMKLWLEGAFFEYETEWDAFKEAFEQIAKYVETVTDDQIRFPDDESKFFCFEPIYLPALQFLVLKCRYPQLRRKGLRLLRACPQKEAIFDSRTSELLFKRVMELEEASIPGLKPGQIPKDDQLPPEEFRIQKIEMPPLPATAKGSTVNFYSKPNGPNGSWHVTAEYINMSNQSSMRLFQQKYGSWAL
ncbi:hypothetical protein BT63DRAFT_437248 [Microthyrium microscopicum]|uniref:C6 zinc finger domain protein n=1 Tax=Microthyrium microscopicum TaxID=703497 RepID=A0A6A6UP79_9PEZI|nr:hypothetical protein BT63DRAFT_437248 [Microthyrium microscopicum]